MAQHGVGNVSDVLASDHVAPVERGARFCPEDKVLDRARSGAPADERLYPVGCRGVGGASAANEVHGELIKVVWYGDASDEVLVGEDLGPVEDVLEFGLRATGGAASDADFLITGGIIHANHEHEAVELGFWQRVRAFLFNGVLRCEDEEREVEVVGPAGDRDASLLHGLEHGGLGFRGCTVDFVGEDDVGEHRTFHELERAFASGQFLKDVGAGDVHRHEVRSELDTAEREREGFSEAADKESFCEARDSHQEGVTAGEQADGELFDDVFLADDDLTEFRFEGVVRFSEGVDGLDVVGGEGLGGGWL